MRWAKCTSPRISIVGVGRADLRRSRPGTRGWPRTPGGWAGRGTSRDGDAVVVGDGDVEVEPAGREELHHPAVAVHQGLGVAVEVVGAEDHLLHLSWVEWCTQWREITTRARETATATMTRGYARARRPRAAPAAADPSPRRGARRHRPAGAHFRRARRRQDSARDRGRREARRRGARSAVGACWDGAGTPGLWPWVQVLRAIRAAREMSLGAGGQVRPRRPDAVAGYDGGRPAAEFHLFEAALQLLAQVCAARPLVIFLDDLQWADPASISLVDFLHRHAVHLPLLVLGTYRADEVARPDHPQRRRSPTWPRRRSRSRWPAWTTTASVSSASTRGAHLHRRGRAPAPAHRGKPVLHHRVGGVLRPGRIAGRSSGCRSARRCPGRHRAPRAQRGVDHRP